MTVVHRLNNADGDLPCRDDHHLTIDRDGADARAHLRHLATVLTISGESTLETPTSSALMPRA